MDSRITIRGRKRRDLAHSKGRDFRGPKKASAFFLDFGPGVILLGCLLHIYLCGWENYDLRWGWRNERSLPSSFALSRSGTVNLCGLDRYASSRCLEEKKCNHAQARTLGIVLRQEKGSQPRVCKLCESW